MNDNPNQQDPRELLGAYALGAVGADERATVERMLLEDADARTELHGLEHAVAWLAHASPRPAPSAWDAVAAEVQRDLDEEAGASAAAPVRLDEHRARARAPRRPLGPIALALAVAAVTLAIILIVRPGGSGADTVALRDARGRTVVLLRQVAGHRGEVVRSELAPAPAGHELQLWAGRRSGGPVRSAGLLGTALTDGRRVEIPRGTHELAISVEPTGGSPAPTTAPVAAGTFD